MKINRIIGFTCVIDVFISIIYLIRSTYMILGIVTLVTLIVDLKFTKKLDSILANRIEFVSAVLTGTIFFVIRTLFFINTKQILVSIMSIVVAFFLMSFYVIIRMILFNKINFVVNVQ